jgi:hypothetical protein
MVGICDDSHARLCPITRNQHTVPRFVGGEILRSFKQRTEYTSGSEYRTHLLAVFCH